MSEGIRHAIVLAAGEGTRLRPFTDTQPKCFVEVGNTRILDRALGMFADHKCETVRIVVGHLGSTIEEHLTPSFRGMDIQFVYNSRYRTTNSMYSLYLALQDLSEPTWVLEGDVLFDSSILDLPATETISWFADGGCRHLDGAYLKAENGGASSLSIVRDVNLIGEGQFKSIGLLKLNAEGVALARCWLKKGIDEEKHNLYYDLVFAEHLGETAIEVVDVAGFKWFEIDSPTDLAQAREMFG
jgi:choline kinase